MKRQQAPEDLTSPSNYLLCLCRDGQWEKALRRCETHPHEANPIPLYFRPLKRHHSDHHIEEYNCAPKDISCSDLYNQTALGIVCSSNIPCKNTRLTLIHALIRASPAQTSAQQRAVGLTPLKQLILNPSCNVEELGLIIEHDDNYSLAIQIRDLSGFTPLDHLIFRLNNNPCELNLRLLYYFVDKVESNSSAPLSHSPLIRLLSLASSCTGDGNQKKEQKSWNYMLECIKYLAKAQPCRLMEVSKTTGCTLLHIALRNFGDYEPLIHFLLSTGASRLLIKTRNSFGDLPLHVACACGVPTNILKEILRKTSEAFDMPTDTAHPLLWSANHSGHSPVDLEWMRHTEGYSAVDNRRAPYPLKANGSRSFSEKGEMYRILLKDTVEQIMREKNNDCYLGELLTRIILIIRAAYGAQNNGEEFILHAAALLSHGKGPCLPEPILLLLHSIYPTQIQTLDAKGRLPLHYALMKYHSTSNKFVEVGKPSILKHKKWIALVINSYPEAARIADKDGRLPLHYALDNSCLPDDLYQSLVQCNPASLERRDPIKGLYPFQQAATINLNVSYQLLRQCPSLVE